MFFVMLAKRRNPRFITHSIENYKMTGNNLKKNTCFLLFIILISTGKTSQNKTVEENVKKLRNELENFGSNMENTALDFLSVLLNRTRVEEKNLIEKIEEKLQEKNKDNSIEKPYFLQEPSTEKSALPSILNVFTTKPNTFDNEKISSLVNNYNKNLLKNIFERTKRDISNKNTPVLGETMEKTTKQICSIQTEEEYELEKKQIEDLKEEVFHINDMVVLLANQQKILNTKQKESNEFENELLRKFNKKDLMNILEQLTKKETKLNEEIPVHKELENIKNNLKNIVETLNITRANITMEKEKETELRKELNDQKREIKLLKLLLNKNEEEEDVLGAPPPHFPKELPQKKKTTNEDKIRASNDNEDLEELIKSNILNLLDDKKISKLEGALRRKNEQEELMKKFLDPRSKTKSGDINKKLTEIILQNLENPIQSKTEDNVENELKVLQDAIEKLRVKELDDFDRGKNEEEEFEVMLRKLLRQEEVNRGQSHVGFGVGPSKPPLNPQQLFRLQTIIDQLKNENNNIYTFGNNYGNPKQFGTSPIQMPTFPFDPYQQISNNYASNFEQNYPKNLWTASNFNRYQNTGLYNQQTRPLNLNRPTNQFLDTYQPNNIPNVNSPVDYGQNQKFFPMQPSTDINQYGQHAEVNQNNINQPDSDKPSRYQQISNEYKYQKIEDLKNQINNLQSIINNINLNKNYPENESIMTNLEGKINQLKDVTNELNQQTAYNNEQLAPQPLPPSIGPVREQSNIPAPSNVPQQKRKRRSVETERRNLLNRIDNLIKKTVEDDNFHKKQYLQSQNPGFNDYTPFMRRNYQPIDVQHQPPSMGRVIQHSNIPAPSSEVEDKALLNEIENYLKNSLNQGKVERNSHFSTHNEHFLNKLPGFTQPTAYINQKYQRQHLTPSIKQVMQQSNIPPPSSEDIASFNEQSIDKSDLLNELGNFLLESVDFDEEKRRNGGNLAVLQNKLDELKTQVTKTTNIQPVQ